MFWGEAFGVTAGCTPDWVVIAGVALGWKEEEVAFGDPLAAPSRQVPLGLQLLLSSPSAQEEVLTQLWKQLFLQDV